MSLILRQKSKPVMTKSIRNYVEPTHDEIATYAYYLWEAEGRPPGRDVDYWLQAEAQMKAHRQIEAGLLRAKTAPKTAPKTVVPTVAEQVPAAESPAKVSARRPAASRRPAFVGRSEAFA